MLAHPAGRLKIATTYRVIQPIENFTLRVRIVQQKSLLAELFETEGETRDTNFLINEERTFAWQEKVFSPFERKFYGDEKNCITDLHKEYGEIVREQENDEDSRLYTYTERDSYYPDCGFLTKNYVTPLSKKNNDALPSMKNRKPFVERYNKKVIDERPSESRIRTNHYMYKEGSTMYILVDLSSKDEMALAATSNLLSTDSQILLCTIRHDRAAKTLTIDPNFTNEDFYTVETTGMNYDYWIEHSSCQIDDETKAQTEIRRHVSHLSSREVDKIRADREAEICYEITLPPVNILRVCLNLEIVSSHGFSYDPLFVTYNVDMPKNWTTCDIERLTGRTQRCRMIEGTAHFSYVTEIPMDFDLNCLNDNNVQPSWPYLLLSVGSLDSWTRYRIEGYTSIPLPPSPGVHSFVLTTWRPVGRFVNVLRRFFTGGTSELEDVTYCGIPDSHEGKRLEKTRLRVVPGGKITIKMNIAHQSKLFMKNRGLNRDAVERLSAGTLMNSLDNVLEQFKAARERMIQARAMNL